MLFHREVTENEDQKCFGEQFQQWEVRASKVRRWIKLDRAL